MNKLQLIKRVVKGGYVKADTLGNGNWEIGRITNFDKIWVWFESAVDGEEIRISRTDAFKATEKEFKEALAKVTEQKHLEQVAKTRAAIEEWQEEGLTDLDEDMEVLEDVEGMGSEDDEDEDPKARSIVRNKYKKRYTKVKSARGRASQICGDGVSTMLAGKELDEVYEIVAEEMGLDVDDLYARYDHLNPGQARMTLGNRLRHYYKKMARKK